MLIFLIKHYQENEHKYIIKCDKIIIKKININT
jgi:hypothetical protein